MKTTMNHTLWTFLSQCWPQTPSRLNKCSTRTTAGRYLVRCDGFLTQGPNAAQLPAKTLATATADKNGSGLAPNTSTRTALAPSLTRKPSVGSRARPLISLLWSPKAATRSTDW
jgi:hypothetical protein